MKESGKCDFCGVVFYRPPSKMNRSKSGLNFCTRKCKDTAQRIGGMKEIHPSHYGETKADARLVIQDNGGFNECERCGYNVVTEILEVHHKDRNRKNNKLENLEVLCPNCHMVEHFKNKDGRFTPRNN